ncbi:MAG: hypothetical protein KGN80_04255, partial [Acidobacteriota bacterium]|nr:hypothetical protein [Acidobacteriota bacterium]
MPRKIWDLRLDAVAIILMLGMACSGGGSTSKDQPATNLPPVVNAGVDQSVTEGALVILSATASDP